MKLTMKYKTPFVKWTTSYWADLNSPHPRPVKVLKIFEFESFRRVRLNLKIISVRFSKSMFLDYLGHGLSVGELSLPLKYLKFLSQSSKQTKSIKISKNWSETKFLNFDFTRIYKFCLEEDEDKKLRNADWLFSYRRCHWWIWILSYHESALSVWTHRGTGIKINDQRKN